MKGSGGQHSDWVRVESQIPTLDPFQVLRFNEIFGKKSHTLFIEVIFLDEINISPLEKYFPKH